MESFLNKRMLRWTVFAALLVVVIVPAAFAQSGTSEHQLVFGGAKWKDILVGADPNVRAALQRDLEGQLARPYAFSTTITIDSLGATDTMNVHLTVTQSIRSNIPRPDLQHIWSPEEVNSMITQCTFAGTFALYTGTDTAHLLSTQLPGRKISFNECTFACKGMFLIAVITGAAMVIVFISVLTCVCCKKKRYEKCLKESLKEDE